MYVLRVSSFLVVVMALLLSLTIVEGQQRTRQRKQQLVAKRPASPRSELLCDGDVSFELITGFVYSSAEDIIDSKIGTLMLSECMEQCHKNPRCQALNFETGLCVIFQTAAGEDSGKEKDLRIKLVWTDYSSSRYVYCVMWLK
ncbi:hypothetical protein Pcinc_004659 [Petrolisthes cinctipes]|uniref:Apple domain-containing protein n=1 Tax=Petrolisthes cinctipes TaxID=88211 RepID=A0AAE1KZW4_PETCI|nr:hypothetical protein Pcinc_004659 [Petrolisthes cinctipes]